MNRLAERLELSGARWAQAVEARAHAPALRRLGGPLLPVALAAAVLGVAASASQARPLASARTTASFFSPSHNLGCEMDDGRPRVSNQVFCQSVKRPHSVRMGLAGGLRICRGIRCIGDAPEGTPVLRYGRQVTVGRFRCASLLRGIRCVVISSGRGFLIDKLGVHSIGH